VSFGKETIHLGGAKLHAGYKEWEMAVIALAMLKRAQRTANRCAQLCSRFLVALVHPRQFYYIQLLYGNRFVV
jgi:hypothetical protein